MHLWQLSQLLLLSFLPFSSFISASPVPRHHPDPDANAAANLVSQSKIIVTPILIRSGKGPNPRDRDEGKAAISHRAAHGNRDVSSKAASIITSTGFLKLASEPSPKEGVESGGTGRRGLTAYSGDAYTNESRDSEDESITCLYVWNFYHLAQVLKLELRYSENTQLGSSNPSKRIVGGTNAIEFSVTSVEYHRDDWEHPVGGIAEARELVERNPTLNPSRSPELNGSDKRNQTPAFDDSDKRNQTPAF
ncbi:hypothetical protein DFH08DRAFT_813385 [Mycena albidolilacea]|uniref:Uncharacterized protein n=1 Tax=Mycena albidolilacea TaxID=1033008 RepID=A0AAD7EKZ0_9AGAR|nr:hypothetical protein DFH08DRAFT_813385 [Mycena albidolilacea]